MINNRKIIEFKNSSVWKRFVSFFNLKHVLQETKLFLFKFYIFIFSDWSSWKTKSLESSPLSTKWTNRWRGARTTLIWWDEIKIISFKIISQSYRSKLSIEIIYRNYLSKLSLKVIYQSYLSKIIDESYISIWLMFNYVERYRMK